MSIGIFSCIKFKFNSIKQTILKKEGSTHKKNYILND